MKLTANTINTTNTLSTARISLANTSIVESITLGGVSVNTSQITVGGVSVTPTAVSVPSLILGGFQYSGGQQGGIIDYQEFTTTGTTLTWFNPYANASVNTYLTGSEQVLVMAWGGGGGAASNNALARAGGGGACVIGNYTLSSLASTVSVTVGAGGTNLRATTGTVGAAGNGGNTVFGSLTAYGGGGGSGSAGSEAGGGGVLSNGSQGSAGGPLGGARAAPGGDSTFGGGGPPISSSGTSGGSSVFGGGGGGAGTTSFSGNGGISIYGGGGGAGIGSTGTGVGGSSILGGSGGSGGAAGSIPGGGGSANLTSSNTGARGEVRVWVFGHAGTTTGSPTYSITSNTASTNVGGSVLYTISTTNVSNNSTLYYTLNNSSTATSADFTSIVNGSVIITSQSGQFTVVTNSAAVANKNFYFDLRTGSTTGTIVGNTSLVTTNPTYSLTPNTVSVFESGSVLYTISTTGIANGTTLYYTLNNSSTATSADFTAAVNGSVIINGNANTFTLTAVDDSDATETYYMDLRTVSSTGTVVANSSTVTINPKTYSLTRNLASFYEGNTVTFTITTTGVVNGTTLYYTLNNGSTATSADFSGSVNGSVIINNGSNTFTLQSINDADLTSQAFTMDVRTGSSTGTIVASNTSTILAYPQSTWVASYNSIANSTSYTFNSVSWGSIPGPTRYIVVAVGSRSGNTNASITGMSINGSPAAYFTATGGGILPRAIGIQSVPTGSSGSVVITSDNNLDVAVIGVWAVYDVTNTTATDVAVDSLLGSPVSATLSTGLTSGDFVAAVGVGANNGTHVWTGGTPAITEDFESAFLDGQIVVSFASAILTGTASQTYTVNTNITALNRSGIAVASFSR